MDSLHEQQWLNHPFFFVPENKGGRSTLAAVVSLLILAVCYLGPSRGRSHDNVRLKFVPTEKYLLALFLILLVEKVDDFKNENGDEMKEYGKDTRFMRFLQG